MYNAKIMEHFQNPRNVGEIDNPDGAGKAGNVETGDVMKMYLRIEGGRIVEARHQTFGSAVAIAVSSIASEMVIGLPLDEAVAISKQDISDALDGIPANKMSCSNMAPDAIKTAVEDYRQRHA